MSDRHVNAQGDRGIMEVNATWMDGPQVPLIYANAFLSQFTPHEFIVSFAQFTPPNTVHLVDADVADLDAVPTYVQAKIVLSPGRMLELMDTLQQNWMQFIQAQSAFLTEDAGHVNEDSDGAADADVGDDV